jgi:hypothetical protein
VALAGVDVHLIVGVFTVAVDDVFAEWSAKELTPLEAYSSR